MLVTLTEVCETGNRSIRNYERAFTRFSRVTINRGHTGSDLIIVGAPEQILEDLGAGNKQLLRG